MAGIGDEVGAHALDPLLLGQVAEGCEHEPRAGRFAVQPQRRDMRLKPLRDRPGQGEADGHSSLVRLGGHDSFENVLREEQLGDGLAGVRVLEKIARPTVGEGDGFVPADDETWKRQRFEEGFCCFRDHVTGCLMLGRRNSYVAAWPHPRHDPDRSTALTK